MTCLARRADAVAVIGEAVGLAAGGLGARRVAVAVGRAPATVRGWLGRLAGRAVRLRAALAVRLRAVAVDPRVPEVDGGLLAGLVALVVAVRDAAAGRWALPTLSAWELVSFVTAGGLLLPAFLPEAINTSPRLAG
ncbi:hypothetical protein QOZ89_46985 [Pseudofrankia sp. BMG5.37]|nr:hypothetical protein [Pseudofrankia sp. BMG5.37]MDT3447008.1 hypothetical protein [Pseudofrankia sp. BMG5.37]MDT3447047.1 hypothetical protein [Pseudofrankia sp. BMG5.37]